MADDRKPELVVAFSTAGLPEEARRIAGARVAEELAACVNVVDDIDSIYRCQGALESRRIPDAYQDANRSPSVIELRLRELHSYEVPELVRAKVNRGLLGK
jgi:periplasmic divalent cation tolerance protein